MPVSLDAASRRPAQGILFMMMTILPSDTAAIRTLAVLWPVYAFVIWYSGLYWNPPTWQLGPRPEPMASLLTTLRFVALALSLWAALPKSAKLPALAARMSLPGRIALRVLWASIRLEILISGIEYLYDSLPYTTLPFNLPELVGWPMIWPPVLRIVFAVTINEYVRRFIVGLFGGCGTRANNSSAAAVLQTMVSGDAIEAVRSAHNRLYCIKMSSLVEADMANNQASALRIAPTIIVPFSSSPRPLLLLLPVSPSPPASTIVADSNHLVASPRVSSHPPSCLTFSAGLRPLR